MIELTEDQRRAIERRYVLVFAICVAIVAAFPALYALAATPPGSSYIGFEYGTDDHLVYSAWIRQAMDGRFLMDNRFAVDAQPGLTIHLYFFLLGQIARVTGIALAMFLARIGFTIVFVFLAYRLIRRVTTDVFTTTLAVALAVLGGGVGFLAWHNFGRDIVRPGVGSTIIGTVTGNHLPIDVWQPEGFVFPSMLTNNLFIVSLCLILVVFLSFLDARESWRPVLSGALAMALLMNIHSYDVLLIAMVMVAFLAMQTVRRQVTFAWVVRSLVIGAGAIPPALWFLHVLQSDPVFQSRAATLTYSATFLQLLLGYLVMVVLGLIAAVRAPVENGQKPPFARYVGVGILALLIVGLSIPAHSADPGQYFLTLEFWVGAFVVAGAALTLLANENPARNLLLAWAVVGLVAPYFPALFQRKLTMGLSIPWAILAALGISALVAKRERYSRNLTTILAILVMSGSSLLWVIREFVLIRGNVSNTLVHSVYLGKDSQNILRYLNDLPDTHVVVVAPGGVASPAVDTSGQQIPDRFADPYMPDLNPVLSGLARVYSYAGHWSETPEYEKRRGIVDCIGGPIYSTRVSEDVRQRVLSQISPNYIVAPVPSGFPDLPLADLSTLGQVVVDGTKFRLVRLRP